MGQKHNAVASVASERVRSEKGEVLLKRGRHSTILFPTRCICAVAAWWFDNPRQKVVPRSRIPRNTSHFSYLVADRKGRGHLFGLAVESSSSGFLGAP